MPSYADLGAQHLRRTEPFRVGGVSDLLPTFVWPSDVDREKARLDPSFLATDISVQSCKGMPASIVQGWNSFYMDWKAFLAQDTPTFGAANQYDLAEKFASDLSGWQKSIKQACPDSVVPGPDPASNVPKPIDLTSIKWAAGAVIALAGIYVLHSALMFVPHPR